MTRNRLEAFSDGVIAIIITIMVLELRIPHEATWSALRNLVPEFLSYTLSFIYIGIYWNNHHHMLHAVTRVNGAVLLANLHLLFWLSLVPFATGWMGVNHFAPIPVAAYGASLLMPAIAYFILSRVLVAVHGPESKMAQALGSDLKGKISIVAYIVGLVVASWIPWVALAMYVLVALVWLVPDRRFE
jgi:uncharacterized membrane protein